MIEPADNRFHFALTKFQHQPPVFVFGLGDSSAQRLDARLEQCFLIGHKLFQSRQRKAAEKIQAGQKLEPDVSPMLGQLMQPVEKRFLPGGCNVIDMAGRVVGLRFSLNRHQSYFSQLLQVSIEMTLANMPHAAQFALKLLVELVRMSGAKHQEG